MSVRPHPPTVELDPGERTGVWVANAPVSFGAFEVTVGIDPNVPDPVELLDAVSWAGYRGIDLGPVGYLGSGEVLAGRLAERGLALAGGFLELPLSAPERLGPALAELDALLDVFDAAASGERPPRPTLADAGSPVRAAMPGRSARDHSVGLDAAGWQGLSDALAVAVARCRERGYEPTFHHETGTYVEAEWEIDRLLEVSDVGLCLDTGHFLAGGGDPVQAIRRWAGRINQMHIKDARRRTLEEIVAEPAPAQEIWRRRAFCPLGEGDIPVPDVLSALAEIGYAGWLVVEQDVLPDASDPHRPAEEQRRNREYLRAHGL